MAPLALHSLCLRDAFGMRLLCLRNESPFSLACACGGTFNARGGRIMRATWEVGNGEGDEGKLLLGAGLDGEIVHVLK